MELSQAYAGTLQSPPPKPPAGHRASGSCKSRIRSSLPWKHGQEIQREPLRPPEQERQWEHTDKKLAKVVRIAQEILAFEAPDHAAVRIELGHQIAVWIIRLRLLFGSCVLLVRIGRLVLRHESAQRSQLHHSMPDHKRADRQEQQYKDLQAKLRSAMQSHKEVSKGVGEELGKLSYAAMDISLPNRHRHEHRNREAGQRED